MKNNINSNKENLFQDSSINTINQSTSSIKGTIIIKDAQVIKIEKILNENQIPTTEATSTKGILQNKDILFNNEYSCINNLYSSINCYVKINTKYDYGKLTVTEKNILVELNKKLFKLKEKSYSDIPTKYIKNNSSKNELPNYKMNDTIDKIITGRDLLKNNNRNNKEFPIYLLNINLDLVTCKLIIHKEKLKFRLLLLGNNKYNSKQNIKSMKVIKFNCLNAEKSRFYHICDIINKSILLSEGYKRNLFGINFNKNYYMKPYISVLDFVKEANTCDILLFRSFSFSSKCQRCVTKGDFDHIVLLIKYKNNLKLYDSIEDDGLRLRTITEFMSSLCRLSYEKISYRKLNINLEDMIHYIQHNSFNNDCIKYDVGNISINEIKNKFYKIMNKKLEIFVKNNKKKPYDFPYCKYLCKPKKTKNSQVLDRATYFCSELVAAVYMFCDIMSNEYDPMDYLPGEFGEKGRIEFVNGFHFGPETIIDFSD